jgi:molybdate transport system substrate-binding protein
VFGPASLTKALQEISAAYTREIGQPTQASLGVSAALARQIEAGTHADVFVSADEESMDFLAAHNLIELKSRHDIIMNRLVLIAPADSPMQLKIAAHFPLAAALGKDKLATGNPSSVAEGHFARAALANLGVWSELAGHIAPAEDARAVLALVARGEAPLGIVFETDALSDKRVRIVDTFPDDSHPPINYPVALITGAKPGAGRFVAYLKSPASREVFARYGYQNLP